MFGMGMPEIILILAIALIVIGPQKLPGLAKSLGRALGEFRKATTDLKESFEIDSELSDAKKAFDQLNENMTDPIGSLSKDAARQAKGPASGKAPEAAVAAEGTSADEPGDITAAGAPEGQQGDLPKTGVIHDEAVDTASPQAQQTRSSVEDGNPQGAQPPDEKEGSRSVAEDAKRSLGE